MQTRVTGAGNRTEYSPPGPGRTCVSPSSHRSRAFRLLRELCALVVLVVALLAARSSLADHYRVPTGSMRPTVAIDDRVVVNKLAYGLRIPFTDDYLARFGSPERGDIVVLRSPEDGTVLLKRVAGVPGDRVVVRGGRVWINGAPTSAWKRGGFYERLGEGGHALRVTGGGGPDFGPREIPPAHYLLLGDNRGDSRDGRSFGLVAREAILGEAVGVYWRHGGFAWHEL